jgi:STE24 endopeptidase
MAADRIPILHRWLLPLSVVLLMGAGRVAAAPASGILAAFANLPGQVAQPAEPPPAALEVARQHYTLTPEQRARAEAYSRAQYAVYFTGVALSLVIYLLLWLSRFGLALRNLARRASRRFFVHCLVFAPLFIASVALLNFPLDYYAGYRLEHRFDLSTQAFTSWLGDWGKTLALSIVASIILVWIFYSVVRRSPRRWWFYLWLATLPLELFVMFIEPWVVEPLFYKFAPLSETQPALTERIETMLNRAGLTIPPSRVFEMNASAKTRTLNAYVSGLGASKRVVVWDTTLKSLSPDETVLVLGHEMGHYVLHHIPKEFALIELVLLGLLYLGQWVLVAIVRWFGPRTRLEGLNDLASLAPALLVLTLVAFAGSPLFSAISRHYEHQADQYGLEVAYGVVTNPNAAEAHSLQVLGELDLADPDPNPLIVFWLYSHPPIEDRIRFAWHYHPWTEGRPMKFVRVQTSQALRSDHNLAESLRAGALLRHRADRSRS